MESSKIALHKWVLAFHLLCSSKKGFSACQLQRELGLGSYRTAWFMLHRIRHAFSDLSPAKLSGTVEVDETYVGGKPRYRHRATREARPTKRRSWYWSSATAMPVQSRSSSSIRLRFTTK